MTKPLGNADPVWEAAFRTEHATISLAEAAPQPSEALFLGWVWCEAPAHRPR
jgi:hypothetical protein